MKFLKLFLAGITTLIIGYPLMIFVVAFLNGLLIGFIEIIFDILFPSSFLLFKLAGGIESISEVNFNREVIVLTVLLLVVVLEIVNSIKPKKIKSYKEIIENGKD